MVSGRSWLLITTRLTQNYILFAIGGKFHSVMWNSRRDLSHFTYSNKAASWFTWVTGFPMYMNVSVVLSMGQRGQCWCRHYPVSKVLINIQLKYCKKNQKAKYLLRAQFLKCSNFNKIKNPHFALFSECLQTWPSTETQLCCIKTPAVFSTQYIIQVYKSPQKRLSVSDCASWGRKMEL